MSVVFVKVCLNDFMLLFNSSKLEEHVYYLGVEEGVKLFVEDKENVNGPAPKKKNFSNSEPNCHWNFN